MKLEKIPVAGTGPSGFAVADLEEFDLAERYDGILGTVNRYLTRLVRLEELPDILTEAAAFRELCVNHEDFTFGWCPWEASHPQLIARTGRFVERLGHQDIAAEIRIIVTELAKFDPKDVEISFGMTGWVGDLPRKTSEAIGVVTNDHINCPAFYDRFGAGIWFQIAQEGAQLVQDAQVYDYVPSAQAQNAAERDIIDCLPDYENRGDLQRHALGRHFWGGDTPFHSLLLTVGERYFREETLKLPRRDGSVYLGRDAHKYDENAWFDPAELVYLLTSTKRDWLCCKVGQDAVLVDPVTGQKVASVAIQ